MIAELKKTGAGNIVRGQSFSDYGDSEGVNQSSLKTIVMRSPAHYFAELGIEEEPENESLQIGSLLHVTTFEPAELLRWYVVQPAFEDDIRDDEGNRFAKPRATKAYKQKVADFKAANAGKTVIEAAKFETVRGMYQSLCRHERSRDYLSEGDAEVGIYWTDPITGIGCKARLDKWPIRRRLIVDLKSSRNVQRFTKAIHEFGYDFQAAWYTWGVEVLTGEPHDFAMIAAESAPPYGVRAAKVGQETLAVGRKRIRKALDTLARCRDSGEWPGYEDPDEWNLPAYAMIDDEPATIIIDGKEVRI